jgi:hypothetical protein
MENLTLINFAFNFSRLEIIMSDSSKYDRPSFQFHYLQTFHS